MGARRVERKMEEIEESRNLRNGSMGGSEDARGRAITSNQHPQPQNPALQRNRSIMRRTRAEGGNAMDRTGGG